MKGHTFSFGDRVTLISGRYCGMVGTVVDPAQDSEILPPPRPGYYWIRIIIQNFAIPAHVHHDDIERIGNADEIAERQRS